MLKTVSRNIFLTFLLSAGVSSCIDGEPDSYTIRGDRNYLTGYEAVHQDGDVNVVVEIPTGSVQKWEVDKASGDLKWEFVDGEPREVSYLGYPGNYGMIPGTLLPENSGGDGDPLDVIVLGPAVERGSVIKGRLVGVLHLLDGGKQDDKLIAVMENTPFYSIDSLDELDSSFHGTRQIVELWFTNYKGGGQVESKGFGDENAARAVLTAAMNAYASPGN